MDELAADSPAAIVRLDLAARLGVDVDDILVRRVDVVTWPDGSLGCPEPGHFYTQVLVPGFHIVLEAGGVVYDYRATRGGAFRLCADPPPGPPRGVNAAM